MGARRQRGDGTAAVGQRPRWAAVGRRLLVLAVLLVAVTLGVRAVQGRFIYLGAPDPGPPGEESGLVEVEVPRTDGPALPAWWGDAASEADGARPAVLFLHGNAGSRAEGAALAAALAPHGIPVLAAEYRGFGGVPGRPSEAGLVDDAVAAYDWLSAQPAVDPDHIVVVGHSLGTGVATGVAEQRDVHALVLLAPFTELADVPAETYPWFPFDPILTEEYDSEARVGRLDVPVAVAVVTGDTVVPPELGRRLHASARHADALVEIDSANHTDPRLLAGAEVVAIVERLSQSER